MFYTGEFLSHLGDINAPGTVFVLTHPGAGILSTELLRQGAKKLMLYEPNPELRKHLQVIRDIPGLIEKINSLTFCFISGDTLQRLDNRRKC